MWRRVWQMACREEQIPEVGDSLVYDIVDASLIIVRTAPDEIRAFHNSCLHRGTQLRTGSGPRRRVPLPVPRVHLEPRRHASGRCRARGTSRTSIPGDFRLPEAQVGTWGGFVFVNLDPQAAPLAEYLEDLPSHFAEWPLEERYLAANVVRVHAVQLEGGARGVHRGVPHGGGPSAAAPDHRRHHDGVRRLRAGTSVA